MKEILQDLNDRSDRLFRKRAGLKNTMTRLVSEALLEANNPSTAFYQGHPLEKTIVQTLANYIKKYNINNNMLASICSDVSTFLFNICKTIDTPAGQGGSSPYMELSEDSLYNNIIDYGENNDN